LRSDGGVFEADGIGRVAPDGEGSGDGKAGIFPGAADDGESWGHDLGSGGWTAALPAEGKDSNSGDLE
jgi:hypothetical protein